eukprot:3073220-Prymnesium_polylepis.1
MHGRACGQPINNTGVEGPRRSMSMSMLHTRRNARYPWMSDALGSPARIQLGPRDPWTVRISMTRKVGTGGAGMVMDQPSATWTSCQRPGGSRLSFLTLT